MSSTGASPTIILEAVGRFDPLLSGVRLSLKLSPKPLASYDPALIGRVVSNLAGNSLKFAPNKGRAFWFEWPIQEKRNA